MLAEFERQLHRKRRKFKASSAVASAGSSPISRGSSRRAALMHPMWLIEPMERSRRSRLTRRLFPDMSAADGLPMDLFGADLVSSGSEDEDPHADVPPSQLETPPISSTSSASPRGWLVVVRRLHRIEAAPRHHPTQRRGALSRAVAR